MKNIKCTLLVLATAAAIFSLVIPGVVGAVDIYSISGNIQSLAGNLEGVTVELTGDLNIADVEWIVQYKIKDPVAYLFNVRNNKKSVRNISEAAMRLVVGDASIDEVITIGRVGIQNLTEDKLQEILDSYKT